MATRRPGSALAACVSAFFLIPGIASATNLPTCALPPFAPATPPHRYDKVINIPNSMTVLPELLVYSLEMAKRKLTGIMNFTNPGAISHNEILQVGGMGGVWERTGRKGGRGG